MNTTTPLSSMQMRQARSMRRNQNAVRFNNRESTLGPVSNTLILALILAVFGLLYLTQITKTSSYGYQVSELNTQKEVLLEERQELEVESARLQALERVKNSKVAKDLTTPESTDFVTQ